MDLAARVTETQIAAQSAANASDGDSHPNGSIKVKAREALRCFQSVGGFSTGDFAAQVCFKDKADSPYRTKD